MKIVRKEFGFAKRKTKTPTKRPYAVLDGEGAYLKDSRGHIRTFGTKEAAMKAAGLKAPAKKKTAKKAVAKTTNKTARKPSKKAPAKKTASKPKSRKARIGYQHAEYRGFPC